MTASAGAPGQFGCSCRFADVDADPGFEHIYSLIQRRTGPSRQGRSRPFENAEALGQLAPSTKQTGPLDESEQFERRSDPLATPKRLLDQTLCLAQLARLQAERAERQDGVK